MHPAHTALQQDSPSPARQHSSCEPGRVTLRPPRTGSGTREGSTEQRLKGLQVPRVTQQPRSPCRLGQEPRFQLPGLQRPRLGGWRYTRRAPWSGEPGIQERPQARP